jgi:serine/threonine protein kinase
VVALDSLHKKNVIHRDVKLGNMLLDADGHIRLCDYGSAIAFDKPTAWREKQESAPTYVSFDVDGSCDSGVFLKPLIEPVYLTNDICGTPYFMSPEQHRGKDYSFDADLWGLGVSIFRMLTGRASSQSSLFRPSSNAFYA